MSTQQQEPQLEQQTSATTDFAASKNSATTKKEAKGFGGWLKKNFVRQPGQDNVVQNPVAHGGSPTGVEVVSANQGTAKKVVDVADIRDWYGSARSGKAAKTSVNMFVCSPRESKERDGGRKVLEVKVLERHPFTAQMFVPMGVSKDEKEIRYLVIVAPTLPSTSGRQNEELQPPYPTAPPPQRKRSLRERLLGARPNPCTNDYLSSTTPTPSTQSTLQRPKGPGPPDLDNIRAFIARGDQAVVYGPGTWHAPMFVLGEREIEFVVVQYANGVALEDCQEVDVSGHGIGVDVSGGEEVFGVGYMAKL